MALHDKQYSEAMTHYNKFDAYVREENHLWSMAQSRARIALVNAYLGNTEQARLDIQYALTEIYNFPYDDLALQTLLAETVCRVHEGNLEAATELVSLLQHHPGSWNETKQHACLILETVSRDMYPEVVQAAIERGKALDLDSEVAELTKAETAK
jgi:hypothetical protein